MSNIRPFQIVLLAVFTFLGVGSVIFLGAYQSKVSQESKIYGDQVIIWGTLNAEVVTNLFNGISENNEAFRVVKYRQVSEASFDEVLVNAIAEGASPDLIILSSEKLVEYRSKLVPIPYETIPLRVIRDTYVDGAEIFALPEGVYALPFAVDPLVQYWNRDMFASNGLAKAPTSWEEIVSNVVPNITVRDNNRNIIQSGLAFGEYRNVTNAKAILMMLAMQSGSRMVRYENDRYQIEINTPMQAGGRDPLEATLQFYTDFSNSNSPLYSWNRAMQNDKNAFISGDLAIYYGFGSEYKDIANKNPNLNFDIAVVPQGKTATIKRTYGSFFGFAIPKAAYNPQGAFAAMQTIQTKYYADSFAESLGMSSPRRDTIAAGNTNPVRQALMNSALYAYSWLDPKEEASDSILMKMVEDVVSNRQRIGDAAGDFITRLSLEY